MVSIVSEFSAEPPAGPPVAWTAVEVFSAAKDACSIAPGSAHYSRLMPVSAPGAGEQYTFEVNLDQCTGCKACVVACHNLNGLDDDETWREVGLLFGSKIKPYRQTVTTSCHNCEDPACANGCPTLAYEKDAATGIVHHLDDQCIGCSYCILKCPYDAPKFNAKRGIVRKCDMCHGRLAAGEAPACVQACPNGAIAIRVVKSGTMKAAPKMVPGVFRSDYTGPTTRYVSKQPIPSKAHPADDGAPQVEAAHTPLAVMLVFTQLALACFISASVSGDGRYSLAGFVILNLGLTASLMHLGQPLKAWKAVLGWRKSWLSREIIAFNLFAAGAGAVAAGAAANLPAVAELIPFADRIPIVPAWVAVAAGLPGILCSVMVYADTKRPYWSFPRTFARWAGTIALLSATLCGVSLLAAFLAMMKMLAEGALASDPETPHGRLMQGPLRRWTAARFILGMAGVVTLPFAPPVVSTVLFLGGELMERSLFFRAASAPRMPGNP